jgi:hypothetical protein
MASTGHPNGSVPTSGIQRVGTQGSLNAAIPLRYQPRLANTDFGLDGDEPSPRKRRYSTMNERFEKENQVLREKLRKKENENDPLPSLTRADQSESYSKSPWARKIVASFGMLLIVRCLIY